jgi:hypothetical protein
MGNLDGLFVTTSEELEKLYGKEVYFGEVLGKHSEIYADMKADQFTVKSDDPAFIDKLVEIIGSNTISGFNPFGYLEEDEAEDGANDSEA